MKRLSAVRTWFHWRQRNSRIAMSLITAVCFICATCVSVHRGTAPAGELVRSGIASAQTHDVGPQAAWMVFKSSDHDFEVALPMEPIRIADSVQTPIGAQSVIRYKASANGYEFDVGFLQRTSNVLARLVGQASILESACNGTAAHMGGKIVASSEMTVDGHAAREIQIAFDDNPREVAFARLTITDARIYHAIIRSSVSPGTTTPYVRRFLDSFHLSDV